MKRLIFIALFILLLLSACQSQIVPNEDRTGCVVVQVPEELGFDSYYQKYCDAGGIPVISAADVDDLALQQAYFIINNMLLPIPDVREELVANGAYFGIVGKDVGLTDLPEYRYLDSEYWDQRARGLGGSLGLPITSSSEEDLLCSLKDKYYGESTAVHEFAHTISLMGLGENFEPMREEFVALYDSARAQGLWDDTYAGSDPGEYWASGVQDYFNCNSQSEYPNGVHNYVNTREELAEYDPALFAFIDEFFHGFEWTPTCP